MVHPGYSVLCQHLWLATLHRKTRPQSWGVYGPVSEGSGVQHHAYSGVLLVPPSRAIHFVQFHF